MSVRRRLRTRKIRKLLKLRRKYRKYQEGLLESKMHVLKKTKRARLSFRRVKRGLGFNARYKEHYRKSSVLRIKYTSQAINA